MPMPVHRDPFGWASVHEGWTPSLDLCWCRCDWLPLQTKEDDVAKFFEESCGKVKKVVVSKEEPSSASISEESKQPKEENGDAEKKEGTTTAKESERAKEETHLSAVAKHVKAVVEFEMESGQSAALALEKPVILGCAVK